MKLTININYNQKMELIVPYFDICVIFLIYFMKGGQGNESAKPYH